MSSPFYKSSPQLALNQERSPVHFPVAGFYVIANGVHYRYLYYQAFGIDACFRFKRREVSSYERDPELGPGYAYLVTWDSYREYLCCFTNQEEVHDPNPAHRLC